MRSSLVFTARREVRCGVRDEQREGPGEGLHGAIGRWV